MDGMTNECPNCASGTLTVYSTRTNKETGLRVRYLKCGSCGHTPPSPSIVPLSSAPMQTRRRIVMKRVGQSRLF